MKSTLTMPKKGDVPVAGKEKKRSRFHLWRMLLFVGLIGGLSFGGFQLPGISDTGAVSNAIVAEAASVTNYVAKTGLNVREQASAKSARIGALSKGDTVQVYSISNGWAEIEYDGSTAYVASKYLSKPGSASSSGSGSASAASTAKKSISSAKESTSSGSGDSMVWLSATGSKYHSRNDCGRMNPSKARQVKRSEAIAEGYEACKKCW